MLEKQESHLTLRVTSGQFTDHSSSTVTLRPAAIALASLPGGRI